MSFPFFRFCLNTRYSNRSLDKALNIVYNWLARRFPTKKGRDGFFTLYGAPEDPTQPPLCAFARAIKDGTSCF